MEKKSCLSLSVDDIRRLAEYAGLKVDSSSLTEEDLDKKIIMYECYCKTGRRTTAYIGGYAQFRKETENLVAFGDVGNPHPHSDGWWLYREEGICWRLYKVESNEVFNTSGHAVNLVDDMSGEWKIPTEEELQLALSRKDNSVQLVNVDYGVQRSAFYA